MATSQTVFRGVWHLFFCATLLCLLIVLTTCAPARQAPSPEKPVVSFPVSSQDVRIEDMHSRAFDQLGGYKGPEACYACHQKQYEAISRSYHVHQGRINAAGEIAHDPKNAVDTGMYVRWYPLSNLDRTVEPEKHWQQMDAIFCAQCHPGGGVLKPYGMDVDCLICHQQSGYKGGQGLGITPAGVDRHGNMVKSNGARLASLMMAGADVAGDMKNWTFPLLLPRPWKMSRCVWENRSRTTAISATGAQTASVEPAMVFSKASQQMCT
jgi:hypothetical protein